MRTTIALSTAALLAMTAPAFAAGHDAEVQTPSGKTVWLLGGALDAAGGGSNSSINANGKPNGRTENAAGGLANAATRNEGKGLQIVPTSPPTNND